MRYDVTNTHMNTPFGFYTDIPPFPDKTKGEIASLMSDNSHLANLSVAYRVLPRSADPSGKKKMHTVFNVDIPEAVLKTLQMNKFLRIKKATADSAKRAEKQRALWDDPMAMASKAKVSKPVQTEYKQYSDEGFDENEAAE